MKAPLYNLKAEKVGDLTLTKSVFGVEINNDLIAQAIRSILAGRRVAKATVKERGDVAGTTKKMYAQKGTGRARHSTAKVGIFVGGGSVHGPQGNQNYELKINKKARKLALNSLLSKFAENNAVIVIEDLSSLSGKTKEAWNFMDALESAVPKVAESKKIGIISEPGSDLLVRAFRNIPGFTMLSTNSLSIYDLSLQNILLFSKKSLDSLK